MTEAEFARLMKLDAAPEVIAAARRLAFTLAARDLAEQHRLDARAWAVAGAGALAFAAALAAVSGSSLPLAHLATATLALVAALVALSGVTLWPREWPDAALPEPLLALPDQVRNRFATCALSVAAQDRAAAMVAADRLRVAVLLLVLAAAPSLCAACLGVGVAAG